MRRHYRRNEFALTSGPSGAGAPVQSPVAGRRALGLVTNPRLKLPALVLTDGTFVSLRSLGAADPLRKIGSGYFEEHANEPARTTGYPRSHTPNGVRPEGAGWGTSLYTALAMSASLVAQRKVDIEMWAPHRSGADGISSWTENRSVAADRWWEAAKYKKLALEETEEEVEEEEDVELDVDEAALEPYVEEGKEIERVNTVSVDLKTTKEIVVDYLPYERVDDNNLVLATFNVALPGLLENEGAMDYLWRQVPESVLSTNPIALMALDVRDLTRESMHLLAVLYAAADLGDEQISELWLRWEHGLDPGVASGQERLFEQNGGDEVLAARRASGWDELATLD